MSSFADLSGQPNQPSIPTLGTGPIVDLYSDLVGATDEQSRYIRLYNKHRPTVEENLARVTNDPSGMFDDIISQFEAFTGGGFGGGGGDSGGV